MQTNKISDVKWLTYGTSEGRRTRKLILSFIANYQEKHGRPPSRREIVDGVGLKSVGALGYQINLLVKAGRLNRDFQRARSLTLPRKQPMTDQEWLEMKAFHWLDGHHILRYFWNITTKMFDGFEVIGEGGIQATVSLSDRAVL